MQIGLEAEARARMEVVRQKKKLEQDVIELEGALEGTNRMRGEVEKNYKKFHQQLRELQLMAEEV